MSKTCLICLEEIEPTDAFKYCCVDTYHEQCIIDTINNTNKCPICKKRIIRPKIYFSGRIRRGDHHKSVDSSGMVYNDTSNAHSIKEPFYYYHGPFPIKCSHGCTFGPATHGCGVNRVTCDPVSNKQIVMKCLTQIKTCDIFVAVIDKPYDTFGTFNEIGFAIAQNKPVFILYEEGDELIEIIELWFMFTLSEMSLAHYDPKFNHIFDTIDLFKKWKNICDYRKYIRRVPKKYLENQYRNDGNDIETIK